MRSPFVALAIAIVLLVIVVVSGLWLWMRLAVVRPAAPRLAATTPNVTPRSLPASPTATVLQAPLGYRLAGIALGEPDSFAVIESPNGTTTLYHLDADVAGLGRVIRFEAEHIVVQTDRGQFELWLAPAATATPTAVRHGTPTAKPRPSVPSGGTAPGSKPSTAPGRPAS